MATQTPLRTADLINGLGVNVHVEYTDGKYANATNVIADLKYLGLNHVRDNALNNSNDGQASYAKLAEAGVKFNMMVYGDYDLKSTMSLMDQFAAKYPGAISSVEGTNEFNNFGFSYNGLTGTAAAQASQSALFNAVNADSSLKDVPVFNLTSWPDIPGKADYGNFHSYAHNGDQPYATMASDMAGQAKAMPGQGLVLTEAGYYSLPNASGWGGVDQATQAKMTMNLIFDAVKLGVKQTFLYELLDAYADTSNSDQEKHFGLFDINNNPKAVATAIHNMTAILGDTGAQASSFQTADLHYNLTGLPSTGSSLVFEKSSGTYDVVVWNEPDIWNEKTHTAISAGSNTVSFDVDANSTIKVYDPLLGTSAIQTVNGTHVQVQVSDHPVIIEVSGAGGSAPAQPPPSAPASPPPASTPPAQTSPVQTPPAQTEPVQSTPAKSGHIDGDARANSLTGSNGADTMRGMDGNDTVNGGSGNDDVSGNTGHDSLQGGIGNDILHGGQGNDALFGGQGNDFLFGDDGNDNLSGDLGNDTMTGGAGADRFVFGANSGIDGITDFNSAQGDRIVLTAGQSYHVYAYGDDNTIIDMGASKIGLIGTPPSQLTGDWLVTA